MAPTLRYVRNKALVTVMRSLVPAAKGQPDEVLEIPSRDRGRTIKLHVYRSHSAAGKPPVLVNFHGSGFVLPAFGTDDAFCRTIATKTAFTVFDVSYRMAPEHPYPAALDDADDAVDWVLAQPDVYDLSRLALSGFSAGACMSLAAAAASLPQGTVKYLIAFYPPTDLGRDRYGPTSKAPDPTGTKIPPFMATLFNDCFAPKGVDRTNPRLSPLYAHGDKFPDNVMIVTCSKDTLANEGEELADKIKAAAPQKRMVYRQVPCSHAWDKGPKPGSPEEKAKDEMYELAVEFLQS